MKQCTAKTVLAALLAAGALCLLPYVVPAAIAAAYLPEATRLVILAGTAMSLNLLVGTTGLLSLGQGLFFGLGAYVVAIATIRYGLSYWSGVALALVLSVPVSLLSALISLRARHLFFGLLTLAIGQVAFVFVVSSYNLTGGDDGLVGVTLPDWLGSGAAQFRFAALVTVAACLVLLKITSSPFGAMLGAVRDNADRVASLGGNPKRFELAAFVIAGAFGALFGAVLAGVEGSVDPHLFSWVTSAMLLMMIALGGRSVFLGPVLGTLVLEIPRAYVQVHSSNADLVVGALVIFCALVFPEGIAPKLAALLAAPLRARRCVAGAAASSQRGVEGQP
ncbi:branched-chain amino acid ABC transporter permease [Paraburkholderia sp. J63]|uniref:branched-chain amino acid ABC transporter permease n=1 Tax=Paraburkholderia sp. J63 TaxID=2805434 RepID=UPI002ABE44C8|nr:branched-chain amino acid ABC transporter permease [Paraburkholderia sp. J63]